MRKRRSMQHLSKLIAALLCFTLMICMVEQGTLAVKLEGLDNFKATQSFSPTTFSDVKQEDWFYKDVRSVYEFNLMVGNSATTFNPYGNVTLAETVALAARLHSIYYTGKNEFKMSVPWYQVYVDYAKSNQIISTDYKDYTKTATRAEYAVIIANAFPSEALAGINQVVDNIIPDVKTSAPYGKAIYQLYRAGILVGIDDEGTFTPNSNISRSEVSALISRMADPSKRITKSFGTSGTSITSARPTITAPCFVVDTVNAKAGATDVAITIAVRNNPGIASAGMLVSFDSALTLKNIIYNEELGGQYMLPQTMANPAKLVWISPFEDIEGDWVLATLYFNVAKTAAPGNHQIAITYDNEDVYNLAENNVTFNTIHGAIIVTK